MQFDFLKAFYLKQSRKGKPLAVSVAVKAMLDSKVDRELSYLEGHRMAKGVQGQAHSKNEVDGGTGVSGEQGVG